MKRQTLVKAAVSLLAVGSCAVSSAPVSDVRSQPMGYSSGFTVSKPGLAAGNSVVFRPYFDARYWSGTLTKQGVSSTGVISNTVDWDANVLLSARDFKTRKIFTRREDNAQTVSFATRTGLSAKQQTAIKDQALLDYLHGDSKNEGDIYRERAGMMGDVVHSNPVYVDFTATSGGVAGALDSNDRVYVGANDGLLHAFNASTGEEVFAYVPTTVLPNLPLLAATDYNFAHRYFVDGPMAAGDVALPGKTPEARKILVSGLGAGGQGYFALDITANASGLPDDLTLDKARGKLLWEINDTTTGYGDLGYSFSMPVISKVYLGSNGAKPPAILVGNGYQSTFADTVVGSGVAALLVIKPEDGSLIRSISTGVGSKADPNGLSSPAVIDTNADGVADHAYAGDLNGNLWRFDLRPTDNKAEASQWRVAFSGKPLHKAVNTSGQAQSITTAPLVLPHPDGGAIVIVGTGRLLQGADETNKEVQSIYGIRDRFNDTPSDATKLTEQKIKNHSYTNPLKASDPALPARANSNELAKPDASGWKVDLPAGERVLTPLQLRSGRLTLVTTNPTGEERENWLMEFNYVTGGAPESVAFDLNSDGQRDSNDNVDADGNKKRTDAVDRVTGIQQGKGTISSPTLVSLSADTGTVLINQQEIAEPVSVEPPPSNEPGIEGGHFDVDTAADIYAADKGKTDGHVHEYDDKYDVTGVDYFGFKDKQLHNINVDITSTTQKFKLIVVNSDLSTGGRFSINQAYDEKSASSYVEVPEYAKTKLSDLPIFSLGGGSGATKLEKLSMFFDRKVIAKGGLVPTETGCVRKNTLGFNDEWRNGALTVWAVAVDSAGKDKFEVVYDPANKTMSGIRGIKSGLLWESTLFWHWKGPCHHEEDFDAPSSKDPSKTVFEYYRDETIKEAKEKGEKEEKPESGGGTKPPVTTPPGPLTATGVGQIGNFVQRKESLDNPDRVSWKERFE